MRCYVPSAGKISPANERLLAIADLMGAECISIPVSPASSNPIGELERANIGESACIVLSPDVMQAWLATEEKLSSLVADITSRFQYLLIHELDSDVASERLLRAFSRGILNSVRKPEKLTAGYCVSANSLCAEFSGLKFGPVTPADRVLIGESGSSLVESLVDVEGAPVFARMKVNRAELFVLGGIASGKAEFDTDLTDEAVAAYFREVVPLAMFLRHAFGNACWRPANEPGATFIVDDIPLWKRYGFLDYTKLLGMMDDFNFHTTIAFIPYYWKNTEAFTVGLFKERPDRLSVCFHGNDHTAAELASRESRQLGSMLTTATTRMKSFTQYTDIPCDNVIVFPQGNFSRAAMTALKEHRFLAAVNSHHCPRKEPTPLTLADLLQPALLTYEGFPLFLRRYPKEMHAENIAWNAFFGRPILIVEHHDIFKDPSCLLNVVTTVNKILPNVRWSNLQTTVEGACLRRMDGDGVFRIRPYSAVGRVANPNRSPLTCVPEWPMAREAGDAQVALSSGSTWIDANNAGTSRAFEIAPESEGRFALQAVAALPIYPLLRHSIGQQAKIHVRRRLSEFRDNYVSRSPATMSFVNFVRQRLKSAS